MNDKGNIKFALSLEEDMTLKTCKVQSREGLFFSKVEMPIVSDGEMDAFLKGLTTITPEDI